MPVLGTGLSERAHWVAALAFLAVVLGTVGAFAQTAGPDEIVSSVGAVSQPLVLTETQEAAIYNAALRHHARGVPGIPDAVPASVGAAVSPAAELAELPDQVAALDADGDTPATDLKYAMVEGAVIVIDPVKMRVVDVIHGNTRP